MITFSIVHSLTGLMELLFVKRCILHFCLWLLLMYCIFLVEFLFLDGRWCKASVFRGTVIGSVDAFSLVENES